MNFYLTKSFITVANNTGENRKGLENLVNGARDGNFEKRHNNVQILSNNLWW